MSGYLPTVGHSLLVLFLALALDLALGEPPNRWHPVAWMGRLIGWAAARAPGGTWRRFLFGFGLVVVGAGLVTTPVAVLLLLGSGIGDMLYVPIAALMLKGTFSIRGLIRAATDVRMALLDGNLDEARHLVSWHLVSRDTSTLDEGLVAAAAVESVAENITDGLVAPLCFFLVGGVPGAWAYRFFNTCDSMLGYRDSEREYLGKFAARWDDALNWLPARMTALIMVPAAWLAGENPHSAWRTLWSQHRRTASPNAGWTMGAMAGALGVTLEKVGAYRLEGGDTPLSADGIARATRLAGLAMTLFIILLAAALVMRDGLLL